MDLISPQLIDTEAVSKLSDLMNYGAVNNLMSVS